MTILRGALFILSFCLLSPLGKSYEVMDRVSMRKALVESRRDKVGEGFCGRGVLSILKSAGYQGLKSANGGDWEKVLQGAGWKSIACESPAKAPLGSVLVYLSDLSLWGTNRAGTKGGAYGHVELVLEEGGKRKYVSDRPRFQFGGTVARNFTKRAWLPPDPRLACSLNSVLPAYSDAWLVGLSCKLEKDRREQFYKLFGGQPVPLGSDPNKK